MGTYGPTGIVWEWAHRRNMTLTQINLFSDGLEGMGYFPAVGFSRHNFLAVFRSREGAYIFYDARELKRNTRAFQRDIDSGKCTPIKLRRLSEKYFKEIIASSLEFKKRDLGRLSNHELLTLFGRFRKAMTVGPIITVQLWGIESCWDTNYKLAKFLRKRLEERGEEGNYQRYVEILSASRGKTVPVLERESFLKAAIELQKEPRLANAFRKLPAAKIEKLLENYPKIKGRIDEHISDYSWITTEYKSEPWSRVRWLEKFKAELDNNCIKELAESELNYKISLEEKHKLLERLKPPADVKRVIDILEEFISQRDWAKGKYSEAFLNWQPLVSELARRMGCGDEDVLFHTLDEIDRFLESGKALNNKEIEKRKAGFVAISLGRPFEVYSKDVESILKKEGIASEFQTHAETTELRGVIGSGGFAKGRARVVKIPAERDSVKEGEILITYMTTMEFTPIFKRVAAVVTDEGGLSSHAAIVSREFGIPAIVGTKIATKVFKTGDLIEVDASNGIVRRIRK